MTIKDNGIGFDPTKKENGDHFGFQYMQERAALFQGKVMTDSGQGRGTVIKIPISLGAMRHE